jgi:hypothetical protein
MTLTENELSVHSYRRPANYKDIQGTTINFGTKQKSLPGGNSNKSQKDEILRNPFGLGNLSECRYKFSRFSIDFLKTFVEASAGNAPYFRANLTQG